MLRDLFQGKKKYATVKLYKKGENTETPKDREIKRQDESETKTSQVRTEKKYDDKIWMKCDKCDEIILIKDFEKNYKVCTNCGAYGRLDAKTRLDMIVDEGSFVEYDEKLYASNPIDFPTYDEKLVSAKTRSGIADAVVTGEGSIDGYRTTIAIMDSSFMMGSMGSVVGEKITRMVERAIEKRLPVIIFTASGGARMQEGILSLMQMAKTSAALAKHDDEGLPYFTVLTDPTTGGVTASFAMLGDIILAEPRALVAFAGPRVIEQTIKQKLPEGFQTSEFLLEKGFVDRIVERSEMKGVLSDILKLHGIGGENIG